MDKNYLYYNNKNLTVCIPRRKDILNYLIKEKFLSEFSTDEEKLEVLDNLGITLKLELLYAAINNLYLKILRSGQNIKTINGLSILGSGNIVVSEEGTIDLSNLVDKNNVKTINGQSILGQGNIDISIDNIESFVTQDNLATINGLPLYNGGNIVISGGGESIDLSEYVTKEELYNIQNPLSLSVSVSPNILEYTGEAQRITITAQAKKGSSNVNATSYLISYRGTTETFNKTYVASVSAKGVTTFNVTCTYNSELASGNASVNLVLPTYIGFNVSSDYNSVNLSELAKKIKGNMLMTETLNNTTSGSYLWIVSPYTLNTVATDPSYTYKVAMISVGSKDGLNYYRSNSAIDTSNLTYYIK